MSSKKIVQHCAFFKLCKILFDSIKIYFDEKIVSHLIFNFFFLKNKDFSYNFKLNLFIFNSFK